MTYTTLFIALGLFFTLVIGGFFGMVYHANSERKGISKIIITIILALAVGFGISGAFTLDMRASDKVWNNGVHADCNGHWEIFDIERTTMGNELYYYQCDSCKKVIESEQKYF